MSCNCTDLRSSLKARGSNLLVLRGNPQEVLPKVWKDWQITRLCFEVDTEDYAKDRDAKITAAAEAAGELMHNVLSHCIQSSQSQLARAVLLAAQGFIWAITAYP